MIGTDSENRDQQESSLYVPPKPPVGDYPPGVYLAPLDVFLSQEARFFFRHFARPGAETGILTASLRPTTNDYNAIFEPKFAGQVNLKNRIAWQERQVRVIEPEPGQTEVHVFVASPTQLLDGSAVGFPEEYKRVAGLLLPGTYIMRVKFVEPGGDPVSTPGTVFGPIFYVNRRHVYVPNPWQSL